ncbi:MAG: C4-dicarboxylate ABC transporter, partial [Gemmatimonadetes bacterium]|nr:C4-dicarboxylate ABC transporter [Gemmatimonadota bacterium]
PGTSFAAVVALSAAFYLVLLWLAAREPDLKVDDPDDPITELPRAGETALTGLYFLLPIVILIWCIVVERLSPALSAFWATIAMIVVALTQHPL